MDKISKLINTKKKKIIIGFILLIIVGVIGVIGLFINSKDKELLKLKKEIIVVEYGEQVSTNVDYYIDSKSLNETEKQNVIKNTKVVSNIVNEKEKNYPAVGKYEINFIYNKKKVIQKVEVKDTTKPKIEIRDNIEEVKGSNVDLKSYITINDLSATEIEIKDNNVDYNVLGNYKFTVIVKDVHGNKATKDGNITIKDVKSEDSSENSTNNSNDAKSDSSNKPSQSNNTGGSTKPNNSNNNHNSSNSNSNSSSSNNSNTSDNGNNNSSSSNNSSNSSNSGNSGNSNEPTIVTPNAAYDLYKPANWVPDYVSQGRKVFYSLSEALKYAESKGHEHYVVGCDNGNRTIYLVGDR